MNETQNDVKNDESNKTFNVIKTEPFLLSHQNHFFKAGSFKYKNFTNKS